MNWSHLSSSPFSPLSLFLPLAHSLLFIFLPLCLSTFFFFLALSFCPHSLITFRLCHVIDKSDRQSIYISLSPLPKQKQPLKQVNDQGSFAQGVLCQISSLCLCIYQVSHVLNVAYGVTNLFPDQLVYKTLQILDLPDTDITSYLGECSSFIDQAREQVHTHTHMISI